MRTVSLPYPHAGQQTVRSQAKRFNWLSAGRRWRKTTLVMAIAIEAALAGKRVIWGAPVFDQVRVGWDETRKAATGAATFNISRMVAEFPNNGRIVFRSLDNPDNVRGHTADGVVIDEAADVSPDAWHGALRPMLIDTNGWAWIIGTPKGLNWFFDGFTEALSREDSAAWQAPTVGARFVSGELVREPHPMENPDIPWDEIVHLSQTTPEDTFKQEILAEFLSGEGAVFRNVDACLNAPQTKPSDHYDHHVTAGIDWARTHDFTALSVVCCHCRQEVKLDRFNQIGWDFQRQRLLSTLEAWRVAHTVVETNSIGSPNLEAMRQVMNTQQILQGFDMTLKSKAPLIQSLALAFERERCQWLPDPVARHELIAYEATVTESGFTKYGAPEGGFDDTVIARALAWKAAKHKIPHPLDENERVEMQLRPHLRADAAPPIDGSWTRDAWETARSLALGKIKKAEEKKNRSLDDPWGAGSPLDNMTDSPWQNWEQK